MLSYIQRLLADTAGEPSSGRVMCFLSLFCGIGVAIAGLKMGKDLMGLAAVVAVFVGGAFGGKIAQSSIENK